MFLLITGFVKNGWKLICNHVSIVAIIHRVSSWQYNERVQTHINEMNSGVDQTEANNELHGGLQPQRQSRCEWLTAGDTQALNVKSLLQISNNSCWKDLLPSIRIQNPALGTELAHRKSQAASMPCANTALIFPYSWVHISVIKYYFHFSSYLSPIHHNSEFSCLNPKEIQTLNISSLFLNTGYRVYLCSVTVLTMLICVILYYSLN